MHLPSSRTPNRTTTSPFELLRLISSDLKLWPLKPICGCVSRLSLLFPHANTPHALIFFTKDAHTGVSDVQQIPAKDSQ